MRSRAILGAGNKSGLHLVFSEWSRAKDGQLRASSPHRGDKRGVLHVFAFLCLFFAVLLLSCHCALAEPTAKVYFEVLEF